MFSEILSFFLWLLILTMLFIAVLPLSIVPSSPVYYMMIMFIYSILFTMYLSMNISSIMCFFLFLIVAGGIMVTFLFFMVFTNLKNLEMLFLLCLLMFLSMFLFYFTFKDTLMISFFQYDSIESINLCYTNPLGMMLTILCMFYLFFVMIISIKISSFSKSSPMRNF